MSFSYCLGGGTDSTINIELKNANTINFATSANEQIDNAELQEKDSIGGLDDNENDKGSKTNETTNVAPAVTDLNNGPFADEL